MNQWRAAFIKENWFTKKYWGQGSDILPVIIILTHNVNRSQLHSLQKQDLRVVGFETEMRGATCVKTIILDMKSAKLS